MNVPRDRTEDHGSGLLKLSRAIDYVNDRFGDARQLAGAVGLPDQRRQCSQPLLPSAQAPTRGSKCNGTCSPPSCCFGAPYTLKVNEHVRVDVIYSALPERARIWIDIFGALLFLLPFCVDSDLFHLALVRGIPGASMKMSSNAGGLIRWPVKLLLPLGFALMALQGMSELIKRIAALTDSYRLEYGYEKPLQ